MAKNDVNIWTYYNSIGKDKKDIWEEGSEKIYQPFVINRQLSKFPDAILYANEINMCCDVSPKQHYYYMLNSLRPMTRRSEKKQPVADLEDLKLISESYGYNTSKAREALKILSKSQLTELRKRADKGGKT